MLMLMMSDPVRTLSLAHFAQRLAILAKRFESTDKGKGGDSDHLPLYFTLCIDPIYRVYKFALLPYLFSSTKTLKSPKLLTM
jgi:hypothetical protein